MRQFLTGDAIVVSVKVVGVTRVLVEHCLRVLLELEVSTVEILLRRRDRRQSKQQRGRCHRRE
jgi:hypothetical protein